MTLLIVIIVALLLYVILTYNGLIKLRNRAKEAWSDIDVQLKRRYNLIPNIVETVKGYAAHEEEVFTKVTEARANAINATTVHDQGVAENMLAGALKSLFAVAENYPELKANENFLQLQNELVDTEDKIQSARRFYNGVVRDLNTKIQQFPAKIVAQMFKFKPEEFFEIEEEGEREPVEVKFGKEEAVSPEAVAAAPAAAEAVEEKPAEEEAAPPEEEKKEEEEPAPPAEEAPAEEEKPSGEATPAVCPKCGGEMTEDHVCPVAEESAGEEKEEEAVAEEPAPEAEEEAVPPEEEKPAEEEAEAAPAEEEEKKEGGGPTEPPAEQTTMPLEGAEEGEKEAPVEPEEPTEKK